MSLAAVLVLGLCGGVGAAARYLVDGMLSRWWQRGFPLATMVINVSGSFLIGVLAVVPGPGAAPGYAWWATGLCGGYTTFSTATLETVQLVRSRAWRPAVGQAAGTLVLCLAAATLGVLVGQALR